MHLTSKDLRRYLIYSLLFIWLILFSHLFYLYLQKNGQDKYVKGGVFMEAVVNNPINPIPYIGNNYYSQYVQSFFFPSCLNSKGENYYCDVQTDDFKTFKVSLDKDTYWSDGRKLTLDDIYFTYNKILKQNQFNLQNLNISNIDSIKREGEYLIVTFLNASVNNKSFFKNYILPRHIWEGKTKDFYVNNFLSNFVTISCAKIDQKSDFINNIILNFSKCKDYLIDKYQLKLLENKSLLKNYLTGSNKIDAYNGYENILPNVFNDHEITLALRYALFWNIKRQTNKLTKIYLSNKILEELKNNLEVIKRVKFNGYGLFVLPKLNIDENQFKKELKKTLEDIKKYNFASSLIKITGDSINYVQGKNNKFFIPKRIDKFLVLRGTLLTGGYDKIGIIANSGAEYILKSYKGGKNFKYIISERFKNINLGKNTYKIFAYSGDNKNLIDTITFFYRKIVYPKIDIIFPEFNFVYLQDDNNLTILGDNIAEILKKYYPGKVNVHKVQRFEYENILKEGNYDLVLSSVNFDGKDLSPLFKITDPVINPSRFVNKNFASLINQDLLASVDLKKKIFSELNKIYQENIPVVFLGNAKEYYFIKKVYDMDGLDYSYFENKQKLLKHIALKKIKQPILDKISPLGFVNFLKSLINNKGN